MERIHLGEKVLKSLTGKRSAPVPLGFVDEDYWAYLARYSGQYAARQSSGDLLALVLEGHLDVESGEIVESFEMGEGFLMRAGVSWTPQPGEKGAVVLQFEARDLEMRGGEPEGPSAA
jgi:hypothetical protein